VSIPGGKDHLPNVSDDAARLGVTVISTSSHPLFSRVERGLFAEPLYYRLNVMRMPVDSSNIRPVEERAFREEPDQNAAAIPI
jgi:transcriptional regulator of acetoin/glycerol metabolism